jgi:hypothetical protein
VAAKGASAVWVAELDPACLGGGQSVLCALADQARLQLCHCGHLREQEASLAICY